MVARILSYSDKHYVLASNIVKIISDCGGLLPGVEDWLPDDVFFEVCKACPALQRAHDTSDPILDEVWDPKAVRAAEEFLDALRLDFEKTLGAQARVLAGRLLAIGKEIEGGVENPKV